MTGRPDASAWRDRLDLLALLVGLGAFLAAVGAAVSAEGAPEIGVIDAWSQVDLFSAEIASFGYLALVGGAALLVVVPRLNAPGHGSRPRIIAFAADVVLIDLVVLLGAAIAGAVAVLERRSTAPDGSRPIVSYYTDSEKVGELLEYGGIGLIAVAVGWQTIQVARAARAKSAAPTRSERLE